MQMEERNRVGKGREVGEGISTPELSHQIPPRKGLTNQNGRRVPREFFIPRQFRDEINLKSSRATEVHRLTGHSLK